MLTVSSVLAALNTPVSSLVKDIPLTLITSKALTLMRIKVKGRFNISLLAFS